jgi:hypothetical protein
MSLRHRFGGQRSGAFLRARGGNVAMLWALIGAVLIGLVGVTVDFTRAQTIRAQLQNAADGAALVAERSSNLPLSQRTNLARAFFDTEAGQYATGVSFLVRELDSGGHRVEISYPMAMSMAKIVSDDDWIIKVAAEAEAQASPPIEVALALDNTGSMSADMDDLRTAAEDLVDYLLSIDGDTVHVALVPFVAQVNIGNGATQRAWTDQAGTAPFNGELLEDRQIAWRAAGSNRSQCEAAAQNPPATITGSPYNIVWGNCQTHPSTGQWGRFAYNPASINYHTLHNQLSGGWKGCVEARPDPYDINDTAPSAGTPATMFVPYFWMDMAGNRSNTASSNSYITDSDGLPGGSSFVTVTSGSTTYATGAQLSVFKYRPTVTTTITTTPPEARGHNRGCPTPIIPLTTNRATIINAVQAMRHWNGGGTNQVEGLAWAWRVLSPTPPFTEGRDPANEDVRKVIVMMTDGENTNINGTSDAIMGSDYSAYSHLGQWTSATAPPGYRSTLPSGFNRNAVTSSATMVSYINTREETLCTRIKAANIEIYTIQFRDTDTANRNRLRNCATSTSHFYSAANAQQLQAAFTAIGSGIGQLRITR